MNVKTRTFARQIQLVKIRKEAIPVNVMLDFKDIFVRISMSATQSVFATKMLHAQIAMEATSAPVTQVSTATVKLVRLVIATIDGVVLIKNAFRQPAISVNAKKVLGLMRKLTSVKMSTNACSIMTVTKIRFVLTRKAATVALVIRATLVMARLVK